MFCDLCIEHKSDIAKETMIDLNAHKFATTGSSNFRLSTIQSHEKGPLHKKAEILSKPKSNERNGEKSEAGQLLDALKEKDRYKMRILFRNAHAVAKNNKSFMDYVMICKLDIAKERDIGETYLNDQSCATFVDYIAEGEMSKILDKIEKCNFFSLTMDGTTDFSIKEQESIFVRSAKKGNVETDFYKLVEPESTTGENLKTVLTDALVEFGKDMHKKLTSVAADGASNMQGCHKGALKLLKDEYEWLVTIHCVLHRLELAYKDAMKDILKKLYTKVINFLVALYYFFKRSSLQRRRLREAFKVFKMKSRMPTRIGGTRWLPHLWRGVDCVLVIFVPLSSCLADGSHENPKAEGLYKLLVSTDIVSCLLFMRVSLYSVSVYKKSYFYPKQMGISNFGLR